MGINLVPQIIRWHDEGLTDAKGWIVIDSLNNAVASGGLFMHAEATEQEVQSLAKEMTKKNALQEPIIGGAKGGIRFDHKHPKRLEVLRRFLLANKEIIEKYWSTGADLNTNNDDIHQIVHSQLKLSSPFHSLSTFFKEKFGAENSTNSFYQAMAQPINSYFKLCEYASGFSVSTCIDYLCHPGIRIIVQGWGTVGSSLTYAQTAKQKNLIVAIIEKNYCLYDEQGLDILSLLDLRQQCNKCGHFDEDLFLLRVRAHCQLVVREEEESSESFLIACLYCEAELFCPCANRYAITKAVANTLLTQTFKDQSNDAWIICGANSAYAGNEVKSLLLDGGVKLLPEWLSNSGNTLLYNQYLRCKDDKKNDGKYFLHTLSKRLLDFLEQVKQTANTTPSSLHNLSEELIQRKIAIGKSHHA